MSGVELPLRSSWRLSSSTLLRFSWRLSSSTPLRCSWRLSSSTPLRCSWRLSSSTPLRCSWRYQFSVVVLGFFCQVTRLHVNISVLWCPLRFHSKIMFFLSLFPFVLSGFILYCSLHFLLGTDRRVLWISWWKFDDTKG
jgi:hypothetical protein